MASESPGGALFTPPNNAVIDTPGTSAIAYQVVPEDSD